MRLIKICKAAVVLLLSMTYALACAQSLSSDVPRTPLVGVWRSQETRADRVTAETAMRIQPDGRFSGATTMNGKPFMVYEGMWNLNGNKLVWTYTKTTPPLPESIRIDTDELISIDDKKLVLRSVSNGQTHSFQRTE